MATRKFSELRDKIVADPVRAARLKDAAAAVARTHELYQLNLRQLRQARNLTQVQLATILGISQPEVSRIERQTDVYLSTLQSYVAAMGGELKLVVVLGDEAAAALHVGDVIPQETTEELPSAVLSSLSEPVQGVDPSDVDITEALAVAVLDGDKRIQALKSVANALRSRGMPNLACVWYYFAAEALAEAGDRVTAARELGAAGAYARQSRRLRLAERLWRRSLDIDPTNFRSRSALGQLLHHQGRYREALENLETVASMDNHATLFLGWSRLMIGLEDSDEEVVASGLNEVITALHRWAYEANRSQRVAWLRQVKRLSDLGDRFREDVQNLLDFASFNSNFGKVSLLDLREIDSASSRTSTEGADSNDERGASPLFSG